MADTAQARPLPGQDPAAYLTAYVQEVTFGSDDAEAVFDRYHAPGFVLYNDGVPLDRARLLAHVRPARKRVSGVAVTVHQALVADGQIAAHYTLTARMRAGGSIATEIAMFGRLTTDGRLREVHQVTRPA